MIAASAGVGAALVALALALLVTDVLVAPAAAALVVASAAGFAMVTIHLCRLVGRLMGRHEGGDGEDDRPGGGGRGPGPLPPFDEPDWWPQFERDLEAYLEARDRVAVCA